MPWSRPCSGRRRRSASATIRSAGACSTVRSETVRVDGEKIGIKVAALGGRTVNVQPEYEDLLKAARKTGKAAQGDRPPRRLRVRREQEALGRGGRGGDWRRSCPSDLSSQTLPTANEPRHPIQWTPFRQFPLRTSGFSGWPSGLALGNPHLFGVAETHDHIVQAPGAWFETLTGLYNLARESRID